MKLIDKSLFKNVSRLKSQKVSKVTAQHPDLQKERWFKLSQIERMANIGSEVIRSLKWNAKNNQEYANLANLRALELFDLTLSDIKHSDGLKEIARCRELWLDYFVGKNHYHQTAKQWKKYFLAFNYAARNKRSNQ